jgi:pimeloyl-ACP methyl ester carboxylesterase
MQSHLTTLPSKISISYLQSGMGNERMIMIHGLGSHVRCWIKNIRFFKLFFTCTALDLPGHGASSKEDYPYTIEFYANVLEEWLTEQKIENAHFMGHSMGGQILLFLAIRNPSMFKSLTLVTPSGFEVFSFSEAQMLKQFSKQASFFPKPTLLSVSHSKINEKITLEDCLYAPFWDKNSTNRIYKKVLSRSQNSMLETHILPKLSTLSIPTSVFFAANDPLIPNRWIHPYLNPKEMIHLAQKNMPNAQTELIQECGHFLQYEKSEEFNSHLIDFLDLRSKAL